MDTPGFDDENGRDEILDNIASWLTENCPGGHQLDGIIYLQPVSGPQMGSSPTETLAVSLSNLLGEERLEKVMLLTTKWSQVDDTLGSTREKDLMASAGIRSLMNLGASTRRFDGTSEGAGSIILQVLRMTSSHLRTLEETIEEDLLNSIRQSRPQLRQHSTDLRLNPKLQEKERLTDQKPRSERPKNDLRAMELEEQLAERKADPSRPASFEAGAISDERIPDERKTPFLLRPILYLSAVLVAPFCWASSIILIVSFKRFIGIRLRPRVPTGHRRLEWTCVCTNILFSKYMLII